MNTQDKAEQAKVEQINNAEIAAADALDDGKPGGFRLLRMDELVPDDFFDQPWT